MLVRVYTCQNATLLEITCHGSKCLKSVEMACNVNVLVGSGKEYLG